MILPYLAISVIFLLYPTVPPPPHPIFLDSPSHSLFCSPIRFWWVSPLTITTNHCACAHLIVLGSDAVMTTHLLEAAATLFHVVFILPIFGHIPISIFTREYLYYTRLSSVPIDIDPHPRCVFFFLHSKFGRHHRYESPPTTAHASSPICNSGAME